MKKMLFVQGWFLQDGLRINLNPVSRLPVVYEAGGHYMFHGVWVFWTELTFCGHIYDACGHAEVRNGTLIGGRMKFEKLYTHRDDVISYTFTQVGASPVFNGSFEGRAVGKGYARLLLIEHPPNFFET